MPVFIVRRSLQAVHVLLIIIAYLPVTAVMFVAGNVRGDLAYSVLDARVRASEARK